MKKQKRILSLLLSAVMGLAVLPAAAFAVGEEPQFPLADVAVPVTIAEGGFWEATTSGFIRITHAVNQETVTFEGKPMELYSIYPGAEVWKTRTDESSPMKIYKATLENGVLTQGELDLEFEVDRPESQLGYLYWGEEAIGSYYIAQIGDSCFDRKIGIHVVEGTLPENVPVYYVYDVGLSQPAVYRQDDLWGVYTVPAGTVATLPYDSEFGAEVYDSSNTPVETYECNGRECFTVKAGEKYTVSYWQCLAFISDGVIQTGYNNANIVVEGRTAAPATGTAQESKQVISIDGKDVTFTTYSTNNGGVNYVRLVDLANVLNGSAAQFDVRWNAERELVELTSKSPFTAGTVGETPYHGEMTYEKVSAPTYIDGTPQGMETIRFEYNGGGYTYYKLRDLGEALGFNVGWDNAAEKVYIETNKPYDPTN